MIYFLELEARYLGLFSESSEMLIIANSSGYGHTHFHQFPWHDTAKVYNTRANTRQQGDYNQGALGISDFR